MSRTLHPEPGTSAFVPRNLLQSSKRITLATCIKMTPAQQAAQAEDIAVKVADNPEKISTNFLNLPICEWSTNASYEAAQ